VPLLRNRPPKVERLKRRGDVAGLLRALDYAGGEERTGPSAEVRAQAAAALGDIETPEVSAALVSALADPSERVREQVIASLVKRAPGEAVDPLCQAAVGWLEPARAPARAEAVAALESMRSADVAVRVAGALAARPEGLGDADRALLDRLTAAAPEALPRTVDQLAAALADGGAGARAATMLTWLSPDSVDVLIDSLSDEARRLQAIIALGRLHEGRAVEPLCRLMLESPNPPVRRDAARALGEIRDLTAVQALMLAAYDSDYDVRTEAASAFDAFGNVAVAIGASMLAPAANDLSGRAASVLPAIEPAKPASSVPALASPPAGRAKARRRYQGGSAIARLRALRRRYGL
jgi:HEAT repeat protein